MFLKVLSVFIGGGFGALLRYFVTALMMKQTGMSLYGTFLVNIIGCLILGVIFGISFFKINFLSPNMKLLIMTGFIGALTTFSTLNLELFCLIRENKILQALIYFSSSCIIGFIALVIGYYIVAWKN